LKYIEIHKLALAGNDIRQMKRYIDAIVDIRDDYIHNLIHRFVVMLKKYDQLDVISFKPGDKYWKELDAIDVFVAKNEEEDILVESY